MTQKLAADNGKDSVTNRGRESHHRNSIEYLISCSSYDSNSSNTPRRIDDKRLSLLNYQDKHTSVSKSLQNKTFF